MVTEVRVTCATRIPCARAAGLVGPLLHFVTRRSSKDVFFRYGVLTFIGRLGKIRGIGDLSGQDKK
jgi:hypothetical protein